MNKNYTTQAELSAAMRKYGMEFHFATAHVNTELKKKEYKFLKLKMQKLAKAMPQYKGLIAEWVKRNDALVKQGLQPIRYIVAYVPLDKIDIEFYDEKTKSGLQRGKEDGTFNSSYINEVTKGAANFDTDALKIKAVNFHPETGRFSMHDGGHTFFMCEANGQPEICCQIWVDLSEEECHKLFETQNDNTTNVTPLQKRNSRIGRKDPVEMAFDKVVAPYDITFGSSAKAKKVYNVCSCYGTLKKIFGQGEGADEIDFAFMLLEDLGWARKYPQIYTRMYLAMGLAAYEAGCRRGTKEYSRLMRIMKKHFKTQPFDVIQAAQNICADAVVVNHMEDAAEAMAVRIVNGVIKD